jgi:hypothetical protein
VAASNWHNNLHAAGNWHRNQQAAPTAVSPRHKSGHCSGHLGSKKSLFCESSQNKRHTFRGPATGTAANKTPVSDTFGTYDDCKLALHNIGTITCGLIVPIEVVEWRKAWWKGICHLENRDNNLRRLLSQGGMRKGGEGLPWPPFVVAI